jgi:WD40 repeat protein
MATRMEKSRLVRSWDLDTDDTKTWTLRNTLKEFKGYYVKDVAFSRDGYLLAVAGSDRTIKLWDVSLGALKHTLVSDKGNVTHVAFGSESALGFLRLFGWTCDAMGSFYGRTTRSSSS